MNVFDNPKRFDEVLKQAFWAGMVAGRKGKKPPHIEEFEEAFDNWKWDQLPLPADR